MAATSYTRVNTRFVTGLQKPKPLKPIITNSAPDVPSKYSVLASLEEAISTMDRLVNAIALKTPVDYPLCLLVAAKLRANSAQLEEMYKGQLDRAFLYFRTACIDDSLDLSVRMQLGYLVELRAMGWTTSSSANGYYSTKTPLVEQTNMLGAIGVVGSGGLGGEGEGGGGGLLGPGEVLRTSGKFPSPTKMPAKNYYKDEVIIKNHDSGKVMGIKGRRVHMIEELSETVISFQRVNPGAKERLVQITGPNEDKIELAKTLIEDTIKRNSSPVRESVVAAVGAEPGRGGSNSSLNSSASDESPKITPTGSRTALRKSFSLNDHKSTTYKHTVDVGHEMITIASHNLDLLTVAMIVLDRHFNGEKQNVGIQSCDADLGERLPSKGEKEDPVTEVGEESSPAPVAPLTPDKGKLKMRYTRSFLLDCCLSIASKQSPKDWERVAAEFPAIVKQAIVYFDGAAYLKKWKESEGRGIFSLSPTDEIHSD